MILNRLDGFSCDHCIKREFQYKKEIECPSCKKSVKKNQLQDKTLEELSYTKELSIRKKVTKEYVLTMALKELMLLNSYNKTEDDFGTLEAFNDYLEHMEDLSKTSNLISGVTSVNSI